MSATAALLVLDDLVQAAVRSSPISTVMPSLQPGRAPTLAAFLLTPFG
jgi:hypothetical protein